MVNAGVIGLGVGEKHIDGYLQHPCCKVKMICDINKEKLIEVGRRYPECIQTISPSEVIEDPDIQIVSIASYDDAHAKQVIAAINAGKHVFVEKPLCLTKTEFKSIVDSLKTRPEIKLSSNLILRKTPRFIELKRRLKGGDLGSPYYLEGDYDYGRLHKITTGWRGEIPNYSIVHGGAIHLIDLIGWLVERRVTEVFAYGNKIATEQTNFKGNILVAALLKFEGNIIAKVTSNYASATPHSHRLCVYGTDGTFQQSLAGTIYTNSRDPGSPAESINDSYPGASKGDMLKSFINATLNQGNADVLTQDVFDIMTVSLAIEESLITQKPVSVKYLKLPLY